MKKYFFYYVFCVCVALFTACSDDEMPSVPASIGDLSTQKLAMGSGLETVIEFSVTPVDAVFNYNVSLPECQIKLETINSSGENYRLTKVEPVMGKKEDTRLLLRTFRNPITIRNNSSLS